MFSYLVIKALLLCGALISLSAPASAAHKAENRVIYEVFVRNFSPEGTLKGVEREIPRLKALGVDVVWLMPIYTPGIEGRWGTYSSPYAVRDYKGIDPDYGTAADLRSLVNTIHANGMEIWLDWVANHTSRDNVWVNSHPEYYGHNFYSPHGWNDVYQLDFSNSALHDAMIDAMQYWVDEFDIDGFRCDYASGPTEEFWSKATSRVLKNGNRVAWLAEDDSMPQLVSNGWFDYNYAWAFHDRLLDFSRGANVTNLSREVKALHDDSAYRGRSRMVYLSNHDVVQDKGGTEVRLFHKYLRPLTVLQFTAYGMPLLYNGQEIGYDSGAVSLAEKTPVDWSKADPSMTELITALCSLKHSQPALNTGAENGTLINHSASDAMVYVYERRRGDNSVVVMLNFGDNASTFTVTGNLTGNQATDVFTGKEAAMKSGARFTLPAQGYAVYVATGNEQQPAEPENPDQPVPAGGYNIYVENNVGWAPLYIYAYRNDAPSVFGNWPGREISETTQVGGVTYKVLRDVEATDLQQTFILNNNSGSQVDVTGSFAIDRDIYLRLTSTGAYEIEPGTENPSVVVPEAMFVIGNIPGHSWDPAYGIEMTRNGSQFRAAEVELIPVDGNENAYFSLTSVLGSWAELKGHRYGAIGHDELISAGNVAEFTHADDEAQAWQITPGKYSITVDFANNTIAVASADLSVVDTIDAGGADGAVYYNLQGARVASPSRGLYIVVTPAGSSKQLF